MLAGPLVLELTGADAKLSSLSGLLPATFQSVKLANANHLWRRELPILVLAADELKSRRADELTSAPYWQQQPPLPAANESAAGQAPLHVESLGESGKLIGNIIS